MPLTREQRSLISQVANAKRWSKLTSAQRRAATQPARDGLLRKYLDQVPVDLDLPEEDRERDQLRRAKQLREADLTAARLKATTSRSKA
jgi:hypothetical protein